MSLRKQWRTLDRTTVGRAPERWGVYELGDDEGDVLAVGSGVLKDELKNALAYGDAAKVRWTETTTRERARELEAEHQE